MTLPTLSKAMGLLKLILLPVAITSGCAGLAQAQATAPTALGKSGDWTAYSYKSKNGKACYVVAKPQSSAPKGAKRDDIFLMVTHRTGVRNEVSTIIGYAFKKDSKVEISVDKASFPLFPNGDVAWAKDPATDKTIVAAMKKSSTIRIKATSEHGTATVDTYSSRGIGGALAKIDAACK